MKKIIKYSLIIILALFVIVFIFPLIRVSYEYKKDITGVENVKEQKAKKYNSKNTAIIIFGAGIYKDGTPMPILQDRLETGYELYNRGYADHIIVSGDNRVVEYNEPKAMKNYLIDKGVPSDDIHEDFAGRRTYDTCYRAKNIFDVSNAYLVTQEYHLSRALFLCNKMGIESIGVVADMRDYKGIIVYTLREYLARPVSFWDYYFIKPKPVMGDKEIIFD